MNSKWKIVIVVGALAAVLATCKGGRYQQIPSAYHGKWKSDQLTAVIAVVIRYDRITVIDEDGATNTCTVDYVKISFPTFGNSKRTNVVCDLKHGGLPRTCGRKGRLYRWTIQLTQDDSEDYDSIDISEHQDTNCDDTYMEMPLGSFYKP